MSNVVEINGLKYVAHTQEGCEGCVADGNTVAQDRLCARIRKLSHCHFSYRDDGRSVIWLREGANGLTAGDFHARKD